MLHRLRITATAVPLPMPASAAPRHVVISEDVG
jgi:hypothetical protein